MQSDILHWAKGEKTNKIISKETLNHQGIVELVSGLDVYDNTKQAFLSAYRALGVDFINRVPLENAPKPTAKGEKQRHIKKPYSFTHLGVYDTVFREKYLCSNPDDIWDIDAEKVNYEDLIVPVPHLCKPEDISKRQTALGNIGSYYPMLYTTLFMWPVEFFGWEVFMTAAITQPDRFHEKFIVPFAQKSKRIVTEISKSSQCPFVFLHDDLADARGPVFPPGWYDDYIFPHYEEIFEPAKKSGRKIMFVADGNMEKFLPKLVDCGVDGIMFENPATSLDAVVEVFGQAGRFFIGGIETAVLTNGTTEDIRSMVLSVAEKCCKYPGFGISSCGGLHGNIPLENLKSYFDARAEIGATDKNWQNICKD